MTNTLYDFVISLYVKNRHESGNNDDFTQYLSQIYRYYRFTQARILKNRSVACIDPRSDTSVIFRHTKTKSVGKRPPGYFIFILIRICDTTRLARVSTLPNVLTLNRGSAYDNNKSNGTVLCFLVALLTCVNR